jgi:hypothetical protein
MVDEVSEDEACCLCAERAVLDAAPSAAGVVWLVPLCGEHAEDGLALLERMFPENPETGTSLDVHALSDPPPLVGPWR